MVDRSKLRQFILDYFSDDELEDLTFDYFPKVQRLFTTGMNKSQKVRELIAYVDRHGQMDHLLAAVEKARSEAFCETFGKEPEPPVPSIAPVRNPQQIFLSYANPDQDFANRLAADIRDAGFDVWIAPDSILPGEKWVDAINRGLMSSGIFLLVLTPDAVGSKWVYDETSVAIALENKNQMRFLTLSLKPADVPPLWAIRQHISFEQSYERGWKSLLSVLRPDKTALLRPPAATSAPSVLEKSPDDRPSILIRWPTGKRQSISLVKPLTRIGRLHTSDLVLDYEAISNTHLLIQTEDLASGIIVRVTDLGSTNGTFLNGQRLPPNTPRTFTPEDHLHLGSPSGESLAITIKIPAVAAGLGRETPPTAAKPTSAKKRDAPRPMSAWSAPAPKSEPPVSKAGRSRKFSAWLPLVGIVALIGIALLAYMVLSSRAEDQSAQESADAAISATAVAETESPAAAIVSATTIDPAAIEEPTESLTVEPADEATARPTAAMTAQATATPPPTPAPTLEATNPPTPPPTQQPTAAPTQSASNRVTLETGVSLDFEQFGSWTRGDEANGTLIQSGDQAHSGNRSAKLSYDFPSAANDYVVFIQEHAIDGSPNAIRLWVYGDRSGHFLNAWIVDDEGQTWQAPFGQILHSGWRQMTAVIDTEQDWPWFHISGPDNGRVDYPIRFRGLVLDDVSHNYTGEGVIYLDDLEVATVSLDDTAASGGSDVAGGGAAQSPSPGEVGPIFFASGGAIYTADPAWPAAQNLGPVERNTCSSEARVAGGLTYALDPAPFCNIGGGTAVCASPNGQYEVLVGTTVVGRSILVRATASEGGNFVFEGGLDQSEGILWSPNSLSFLFVSGDTIYQAYPDGRNQMIIQAAYSPQFSPDSQRIAFVRIAGSTRDVYTWAEGVGEQNVSNLGLAEITCPRWASGG